MATYFARKREYEDRSARPKIKPKMEKLSDCIGLSSEYATYIINRSPTKANQHSDYLVWFEFGLEKILSQNEAKEALLLENAMNQGVQVILPNTKIVIVTHPINNVNTMLEAPNEHAEVCQKDMASVDMASREDTKVGRELFTTATRKLPDVTKKDIRKKMVQKPGKENSIPGDNFRDD
uniref:AlNc14C1061G12748 protein n=1 Tax=Albugo laibachii Nc14 TaxID=890382 RepID=F0X2H1_9STRA|nr:AlNc14C1061G12748 [Albugo laibachii Nc14]|eukprot:CCA28068.1 AlNc14C1061G12748 [Albugo laibachii Nc14]